MVKQGDYKESKSGSILSVTITANVEDNQVKKKTETAISENGLRYIYINSQVLKSVCV